MLKRLHAMLTYKRKHNSESEEQWIEKFLAPYGMTNLNDMALVVITNDKSRTLFSCHTDSVHRTEGKQIVKFDKQTGEYYKDDGEALGADDAAGAWLMLEMIDANVPGTYVFHRAEEVGGIGSRFLAAHYDEFLKGYDRAIAFDRRGSTSVITHQGMGRCCSDVFAEALSDALNKNEACMYMPDATGIFTDTANYTEIIPECTNISCGYSNEHTAKERLHLPTLLALREACLQVDWESLPTERDPTVPDPEDYNYLYAGTTNKSIYNMSRSEMVDMAYVDPETFVDLVRKELLGEDSKYDDYAYDESFKYAYDYDYGYDYTVRRR